MKLNFLILFLYCLVNTYNYTVIDIKGDGCFNFLHKVGFYWVNPILQGESNRSPQLIIVHQSSWNALNGLIFYDFVPCNIRKFLGSPFLGFLFKISKNFYVDHFFHIQSKGGPFYTSKNASIFGSFLGSKMIIIQLQMHK